MRTIVTIQRNILDIFINITIFNQVRKIPLCGCLIITLFVWGYLT